MFCRSESVLTNDTSIRGKKKLATIGGIGKHDLEKTFQCLSDLRCTFESNASL